MATLSNWNQTQQILLAVAGIPAGVMSFLASATIVIMIFRSPTKLKNPFRRIIFSISCYDSIQSMVFVFAAFLSPVGSTWGAMGNTYTCNLFGCLFHLSSVGSPLYTFLLALFYMCAIKLNMSNENFKRKYEVLGHIMINVAAWSSSVFLTLNGNMNFSADTGVCWIEAYPQDCIHNDEVDCERGQRAYLFQWIFAGGPILVCTVGLVTILCIMIWNIYVLQRNMRSLRESWRHPVQSDNHNEGNAVVRRISRRMSSFASSIVSLGGPPHSNNHSDTSSSHHTLPSRSNRRRLSISSSQQANSERDDLIKQAILYSSSFLLIYLFPYIYHIINQLNGSAPFPIILAARILGPFQGVLNIIIYTRIRVSNICAQSDCSWLSAFWLVVTSGVDHEIIARRQSHELRSSFTNNEVQRSSTTGLERNSTLIPSKSKSRRTSVSFSNQITDVLVEKGEQADVGERDEAENEDVEEKEAENKKTNWESNQDSLENGIIEMDSKEDGGKDKETFDLRALDQPFLIHPDRDQSSNISIGKVDDQDPDLLVIVDNSSEICTDSDEQQLQINNEASPQHIEATND